MDDFIFNISKAAPAKKVNKKKIKDLDVFKDTKQNKKILPKENEKNVFVNTKSSTSKNNSVAKSYTNKKQILKSDDKSESQIVKQFNENEKTTNAESSKVLKDPSRKPFKKSEHKAAFELEPESSVQDVVNILSSSLPAKFEPVFSEKNFDKFSKLHPHLVKTLSDKMSISIATAIQEKAIPALLNGKDVLIKSATGSGKTLSYAIPLVHQLQAIDPPISRQSGIRALIITPTRELAVQTQDVLTKLTTPFVRIVTGVLIGGVKAISQKRALRKGLNILIVTPNRLQYHLDKSEHVKFDQLQWIVVDEADRMLEMGFGETVKKILAGIGNQKNLNDVQTVLLSATLTDAVENIAELTLKNPVRAVLDTNDTTANQEENSNEHHCQQQPSFRMPSGLEHFLLVCPTKYRLVALMSFLLLKCKYGKHTGKVVVFMATQDLVEFHYQLFKTFLRTKEIVEDIPNAQDTSVDRHVTDIDIFQLHGGMEHDRRQAVIRDFSNSSRGFLLTTDVCSRGIDMSGIQWVVQYHPPGNPIDYVHRVGRTARAGTNGKALLFLQPPEINYVEHLQTSVGGVEMKKLAMKNVMQAVFYHTRDLKKNNVKKKEHTLEESVFVTAKMLEEHVESDLLLKDLARTAFKSLVRSYACFSTEMREYFSYKNLHLGHVAKSLALRETPREISRKCQGNNTEMNVDKQKKFEAQSQRRKRPGTALDEKKQPAKKKHMDQATRNMYAEFGL